MEIDVASLDVPSRYKLLIGCVTPRPIAFVSTISPNGKPNLAPFSFFTAVGSHPMTLLFCPANKPDGSDKDTLRNAAPEPEGGVGQFVVNVASERYARQVAAAAEPLAYGASEFELAGLTTAPSAAVRPPRAAESPVAFECETTRIIRMNPGEPGGGNIVMGRVVHVFVADGVLNDRFHADPAQLQTIGRMGGLQYCTSRDRFEMPMGRAALDQDQG